MTRFDAFGLKTVSMELTCKGFHDYLIVYRHQCRQRVHQHYKQRISNHKRQSPTSNRLGTSSICPKSTHIIRPKQTGLSSVTSPNRQEAALDPPLRATPRFMPAHPTREMCCWKRKNRLLATCHHISSCCYRLCLGGPTRSCSKGLTPAEGFSRVLGWETASERLLLLVDERDFSAPNPKLEQ
jgi:hypothetical protein